MTIRTAGAMLVVALISTSAAAYPSTYQECKDAGGTWVEKDTPQGCEGFCYLKLEPMLSFHGNGGGGHGGGGGGGCGGMLDAVMDRLVKDIRDGSLDGVAGDVALSVADRTVAAGAGTTCTLDPAAMASPDGQHVATLLLRGPRQSVSLDGSYGRVDRFFDINVGWPPGAPAPAIHVVSIDWDGDGTYEDVLLDGSVTLEPALHPDKPGGDPRCCILRDAVEWDFQFEGGTVHVRLPFAP